MTQSSRALQADAAGEVQREIFDHLSAMANLTEHGAAPGCRSMSGARCRRHVQKAWGRQICRETLPTCSGRGLA